MSDLIRRMDAMQACQVGPSDEWSRDTKSGYNQAATDCAMNILRSPAVTVQAQIDAAVAAERERWEDVSMLEFANKATSRTIRNINARAAAIRKGEQP